MEETVDGPDVDFEVAALVASAETTEDVLLPLGYTIDTSTEGQGGAVFEDMIDEEESGAIFEDIVGEQESGEIFEGTDGEEEAEDTFEDAHEEQWGGVFEDMMDKEELESENSGSEKSWGGFSD
ncbi:hypothetical protein MMC22_004492 [Lobaria immixta]|nr:hypothetical protein [Lobaria immixta]